MKEERKKECSILGAFKKVIQSNCAKLTYLSYFYL